MWGRSPPMPKNGHFKAEGLFIGWAGKIRNNLYFGIIAQHTNFNLTPFKILGAYD